MTAQRLKPFHLVLLHSVICLGLGLLLLPPLVNSLRSSFWPKCTGTVVISEVKQTRRKRIGIITYSYVIDGRRYSSSRYDPFGPYLGPSPEEVVKEYPEGKTVLVSFNPRRPDVAYLIPGLQWDDGIMVFPLLLSSWFLVKSIMQLRDKGGNDEPDPSEQ